MSKTLSDLPTDLHRLILSHDEEKIQLIKLTNNDDPKEFTLEITRMRDIRQRIEIIVADYNNYLLLEGKKYKPSYNILAANDYSFYTVFRGDFDSYNECKQKRDELYDYYNKKAMNATKKEQRTNIVSFE